MREASSAGFRKIANFIFGKSSYGPWQQQQQQAPAPFL
jgi:hypothetical protein